MLKYRHAATEENNDIILQARTPDFPNTKLIS
jgi:hypothetical protein